MGTRNPRKSAAKVAKKKTLTVRADAEQSEMIDRLIIFTDKKTATSALIHAGENYIDLVNERNQLRRELAQLEHRFRTLISDVQERDALNSQIDNQIEEAAKLLKH
jgi:acetyl-CoA carboxylase carboxyltransferase component